MKTQEAVRALTRALKGLDPEQGPRARRNARRRVLAALRRVRTQMDEVYPALRTSSAPRAKRVSALAVSNTVRIHISEQRLRKAGFLPAQDARTTTHSDDDFVAACALLGIRLRLAWNAVLWAPAWAVAVAGEENAHENKWALLRRAQKMTVRQRRALLSELALKRATEPSGGQ